MARSFPASGAEPRLMPSGTQSKRLMSSCVLADVFCEARIDRVCLCGCTCLSELNSDLFHGSGSIKCHKRRDTKEALAMAIALTGSMRQNSGQR